MQLGPLLPAQVKRIIRVFQLALVAEDQSATYKILDISWKILCDGLNPSTDTLGRPQLGAAHCDVISFNFTTRQR